MTGRTRAASALLVAALLLTGCSDQSSEAGFGLPTLDDAGARDALSGTSPAPLEGELVVASNGCFHWRGAAGSSEDGAWIVWPHDARHDADEVVLGDGRSLGDGDGIAGSGALVSLADLPQGAQPDSYFGSFGGFCGADESGVLVLTDAEPASGDR